MPDPRYDRRQGNRARRLIGIGIKLAVSFGLIAFLLAYSNRAAITRHIGSLPVWSMAAGVALLAAQGLIMGLRWWLIIQRLGGRADALWSVRLSYIGMFFSQILPTSIGGDVVRAVEAYRAGLSVRLSANSVLIERFTGVVTLLLLMVAALPFAWSAMAAEGRWLLLVLVEICLIGGITFIVLLLLVRLSKHPVLRPLGNLSADLSAAGLLSPDVLSLLGLGVLSNIAAALASMALGVGLGIDLPLTAYLTLLPATVLFTLVPISVGGWGVRETATMVLFGTVGLPGEAAFTLSVLFGLAVAGASLPGAVLWIVRDQQQRQPTN